MKPDKVLAMLSIAAKAGKVVSGEFSTEKAINSGSAVLVIIASDASANTTKKFKNSCEFYQVPVIVYGESEALGHSIGREFRKTLAITDVGIAESILKKMEVNE